MMPLKDFCRLRKEGFLFISNVQRGSRNIEVGIRDLTEFVLLKDFDCPLEVRYMVLPRFYILLLYTIKLSNVQR
jgi:hypothetical protein